MSAIHVNTVLDSAGGNTVQVNGDVALNRSTNINPATAVSPTGVASITFTGIPTWARRITVMIQGSSTNGTSALMVQAGTGGNVVTTGYLGSGADIVGGVAALYTNGFGLGTATGSAALHNGSVVLENLTGNVWVARGSVGRSDNGQIYLTAGSITLAGALDRIRITTAGGVNTFDAGTYNVSWE